MTNPEFEFEFFLAESLGMLRGQLINRVSNREFVAWNRYYALKAQRQDLEAKKQAARARRR